MALIIAGIGVVGRRLAAALARVRGHAANARGVICRRHRARHSRASTCVGSLAASRAPIVFRVFGIIMIVAGVLTPFFGVERSRAVFDWWSLQTPLFMRAWGGVGGRFRVLRYLCTRSSSPSCGLTALYGLPRKCKIRLRRRRMRLRLCIRPYWVIDAHPGPARNRVLRPLFAHRPRGAAAWTVRSLAA